AHAGVFETAVDDGVRDAGGAEEELVVSEDLFEGFEIGAGFGVDLRLGATAHALAVGLRQGAAANRGGDEGEYWSWDTAAEVRVSGLGPMVAPALEKRDEVEMTFDGSLDEHHQRALLGAALKIG